MSKLACVAVVSIMLYLTASAVITGQRRGDGPPVDGLPGNNIPNDAKTYEVQGHKQSQLSTSWEAEKELKAPLRPVEPTKVPKVHVDAFYKLFLLYGPQKTANSSSAPPQDLMPVKHKVNPVALYLSWVMVILMFLLVWYVMWFVIPVWVVFNCRRRA